jgi:hypothetical protein
MKKQLLGSHCSAQSGRVSDFCPDCEAGGAVTQTRSTHSGSASKTACASSWAHILGISARPGALRP